MVQNWLTSKEWFRNLPQSYSTFENWTVTLRRRILEKLVVARTVKELFHVCESLKSLPCARECIPGPFLRHMNLGHTVTHTILKSHLHYILPHTSGSNRRCLGVSIGIINVRTRAQITKLMYRNRTTKRG